MIPTRSLMFPLLERYPYWSTCGRRTRPFSERAFREHRTNMGAPPILFIVGALRARGMVASPSPLQAHSLSPHWRWSVWSPTARNFLTRPPTGTPRRAISPGEGLPRPRVARARETNRLPSLLLCGSLPASRAGLNFPASDRRPSHSRNP